MAVRLPRLLEVQPRVAVHVRPGLTNDVAAVRTAAIAAAYCNLPTVIHCVCALTPPPLRPPILPVPAPPINHLLVRFLLPSSSSSLHGVSMGVLVIAEVAAPAAAATITSIHAAVAVLVLLVHVIARPSPLRSFWQMGCHVRLSDLCGGYGTGAAATTRRFGSAAPATGFGACGSGAERLQL
jgi:hypothetical protein